MNYDNLQPLAKLDDWALDDPRQDIRGRPMLSADGRRIGVVREMLVDRDEERVAALTVDNGEVYPIRDVAVAPDGVRLRGAEARPTPDGHDRETLAGEETRIPIVEEHIRVGKREVERGGVRVETHVVETPVHEEVTLRQERVDIERRPVNEPVRDAERLFEERSFEISERGEEAVVGKEAVVKEELVVRKDEQERIERIDDTVRRTVVDVDDARRNPPPSR